MLSAQYNHNGSSNLTFNTKTGKFEIKVYLNGGKSIYKSYYLYKHAVRVLKRLRKKYKLD